MLLAVSLKMYLDPAATRTWVEQVAALAKRHPAVQRGDVSLWLLPSMPALAQTIERCRDTPVAAGAQDLFWEDRGAYTGAVSGADLAQIGCTTVEIGHAERRTIFGEDDAIVARKTAAAVRNGLVPLLCVGEYELGDSDAAAAFCIQQLESALGWLNEPASVVVAYEPVWAIGQSEAASSAHVGYVARAIKAWLAERPALADARVIYGGSAAPGTLSELGGAVDGLFLGRFAHDTAAFEQIVDEAAGIDSTV